MKRRLVGFACLCAGLAFAGCGGGGGKVSSSSLNPRLLPASAVPGFGLQRTFDWGDPVNLVGEGLALPQITHPSSAVKEFKNAHLKGAAGEVLSSGAGPNATDVRVGVARFGSASDANRVRDWMHTEDLHEPCFTQCVYSTRSLALAGIPGSRYVVQSAPALRPPSGAKVPPGAGPQGGPANYLAEFTIGPYLYWAVLQADATAKARFETGLQRYYAHAKATG